MHSTYQRSEKKTFYPDLFEALKKTKKEEIIMILGDLSAEIGKGTDDEVLGEHRLDVQNGKKDKLVQFCIDHKRKLLLIWRKIDEEIEEVKQ